MISAVDNDNNEQQWTTIRGATCISDAVFILRLFLTLEGYFNNTEDRTSLKKTNDSHKINTIC